MATARAYGVVVRDGGGADEGGGLEALLHVSQISHRRGPPRDSPAPTRDDAGAPASLPRRRARRAAGRARDVPGLEGALKEWLRENDA